MAKPGVERDPIPKYSEVLRAGAQALDPVLQNLNPRERKIWLRAQMEAAKKRGERSNFWDAYKQDLRERQALNVNQVKRLGAWLGGSQETKDRLYREQEKLRDSIGGRGTWADPVLGSRIAQLGTAPLFAAAAVKGGAMLAPHIVKAAPYAYKYALRPTAKMLLLPELEFEVSRGVANRVFDTAGRIINKKYRDNPEEYNRRMEKWRKLGGTVSNLIPFFWLGPQFVRGGWFSKLFGGTMGALAGHDIYSTWKTKHPIYTQEELNAKPARRLETPFSQEKVVDIMQERERREHPLKSIVYDPVGAGFRNLTLLRLIPGIAMKMGHQPPSWMGYPESGRMIYEMKKRKMAELEEANKKLNAEVSSLTPQEIMSNPEQAVGYLNYQSALNDEYGKLREETKGVQPPEQAPLTDRVRNWFITRFGQKELQNRIYGKVDELRSVLLNVGKAGTPEEKKRIWDAYMKGFGLDAGKKALLRNWKSEEHLQGMINHFIKNYQWTPETIERLRQGAVYAQKNAPKQNIKLFAQFSKRLPDAMRNSPYVKSRLLSNIDLSKNVFKTGETLMALSKTPAAGDPAFVKQVKDKVTTKVWSEVKRNPLLINKAIGLWLKSKNLPTLGALASNDLFFYGTLMLLLLGGVGSETYSRRKNVPPNRPPVRNPQTLGAY